jgi:hypothetical protein
MSRLKVAVDQPEPKTKFLHPRIQLILEKVVPGSILRMCRNLLWTPIRQRYAQLSVAEAFAQTYRYALWGKIESDQFFSGRGSLEKFATPYIEWLTGFINEHNVGTVVDLGCGDFRIGRQICSAVSVNYVGVDIVPDLIRYNQSQFESERLSFKCANIIEDELPDGELCLIRQVLQHLSNDQISSVLTNCAKYSYLVITEGVYGGKRTKPNLDITHGPDTRIFKRSGVFLDRAPFNVKTQNVLEIPYPEIAAVMRTCLIEREGRQQLQE